MPRHSLLILFGILAAQPLLAADLMPQRSDRLSFEYLWRESYPHTLRWDELENDPLRRNVMASENTSAPLTNNQDEWIFRLHANSAFRVHDEKSNDCLSGVTVMQGNGSGLFIESAAQCANDGHDIIVTDDKGQERIFLVRDGRETGGALRFFHSRRESPPVLTPQREPIGLDAPLVRVSEQSGQHRRYAALVPGKGTTAEIQGPTRLEVQTRLYYPPAEGPTTQWPTSLICYAKRGFSAPQQARNSPQAVDHYQVELRVHPLSTAATGKDCHAGECDGAHLGWQKILDYDTTPAYHAPVKVDGCAMPTGQLETRYVDLPAGHFQLHVDVSSATLLRIEAQSQSNWLLPAINSPALSAAQLGSQTQSAAVKETYSRLQAIMDSADRLRTQNTRSEGALQAIASLEGIPASAPARPDLLDIAQEWRGRHSFFRNLSPDSMASNAQQGWSLAIPYAPVPLATPRKAFTTSTLHVDSLLQGLSSALFSAPGNSCDGDQNRSLCCHDCPRQPLSLSYQLPYRSAHSDLQIMADTRRLARPVALWIQLQGQEARRMIVHPAFEFPTLERLPSKLEAALALLNASSEGIEGLFARARLNMETASLPWVAPAQQELPLPANAKGFKVWSSDPAVAELRFAFRYRVAKPDQLTKPEYLKLLAALPAETRLDLFLDLLGRPDTEETEAWYAPAGTYTNRNAAQIRIRQLQDSGVSARLVETLTSDNKHLWSVQAGPFEERHAAVEWRNTHHVEGMEYTIVPAGLTARVEAATKSTGQTATLAQHWFPLLSMLDDLAEHYQTAVEAHQPAPTDQSNNSTVLNKARAALHTANPTHALELLGSPYRWLDSPRSEQALMLQISALRQAGERALAERILRGIALFTRQSELRDWAIAELENEYRIAGRNVELQGLYASLIRRGDNRSVDWIGLLATQLIADGDADLGLDLAMLLSPEEQPSEAMIVASIETRNWYLFDHLIENLTIERRSFWLGYRNAITLDLSAARQAWSSTNAEAELTHLNQGLAIARALSAPEEEERANAIASWRSWLIQSPGPWRWQSREDIVTDSAGVIMSHMARTDKLLAGYRANSRQPLNLRIEGPALLRLEMRPLHQGNTPIDGWISVHHNGTHKVVPVFNNRAAPGWTPLTGTGSGVGQAETSLLDLGPGEHAIAIHSERFELFVRPQILQPALRLPLLPDVNSQNLESATQGDWLLKLPVDDYSLAHPRLRQITQYGNVSPRLDEIPLPKTKLSHSPPLVATHWPILKARPYWNSPVAIDEQPAWPANPDNPALRREAMMRAAWHAEHADNGMEAATLAEALAVSYPTLPDEGAILGQLRRNLEWWQVNAMHRELGITRLAYSGWRPENSSLRIRQALMAPDISEHHVLRQGDRLTLQLRRLRDARLRIRARLIEMPWTRAVPAELSIKLNNSPAKTLSLNQAGESVLATLDLAPDEHVLSIKLDSAYTNQFVALEIFDETLNQWLRPEAIRDYHITRQDNPLEMQVRGPALLAIDQYFGERISTQYRYIPENQERIVVGPPQGTRESLVRIRHLVKSPITRETTPSRRQPTVIAGLPGQSIDTSGHLASPLRLIDQLPLGGQEDGTWSTSLGYVSLGAEEESGIEAERDRYFEVITPYRREFDTDHIDLKLEPLARFRSDGTTTLGLRAATDWRPDDTPWAFTGKFAGYTQNLNSRIWGGDLSLAASRPWHWNEKWSTRFEATLVQRYVPTPDLAAGEVADRSIFSPYRQDHPRAVWLASGIDYLPWMDTAFDADFTIASNDPLHDSGLDYARLDLRWRQLLGDFDLELKGRWQELLDDADRTGGATRRSAMLSVGYDRWVSSRSRWSLRLGARIDTDIDDHSYFMRIEYSFANGRHYKDFRGGEIPFINSRKRRALGSLENNIMGTLND